MTLTRESSRRLAIITVAVLAIAFGLFGGNQRQVHAATGGQIVNTVFCILNQVPTTDIFDVPGCHSQGGHIAQCSDTVDNDTDGFIDAADPNCHTDSDPSNSGSYDPNKDSESGSLFECLDGKDNDGDGKIDWNPIPGQGDPDCATPLDPSESGSTAPGTENTLPLCSDTLDNDGDNLIDLADPDCASFKPVFTLTKVVVGGTAVASSFSLFLDGVAITSGVATTTTLGSHTASETASSSYTGAFTGDCNSSGQISLAIGDHKACVLTNTLVGSTTPTTPACSDGQDNDGDGLTDLNDPGCSDASDTDETDTTSGGSSSGGGSGGGGHHRNGSGSSGGLVLGAETDSCSEYLTAYIRMGQANDPEQVRRLQTVLKDFEGASIDVNGIYDAATLAAVNAFQIKYGSDILGPWGIRQATGYVYLTTRKKINEVYCKGMIQFPLTPAQAQEITRVRMMAQAAPASDTSASSPMTGTSITTPPTSGASSDTDTSSEDGDADDTQSSGSWWSNFTGWFSR